jgi:hypothetical protein
VLSSPSAITPGARSRGLHLASQVQTANAGARRCIGSALSQSPARKGHSTCMRNIFDDPLRPLALRQRPHDVIYPPLPNISRQLSPLKKHHQNRKAAPRLYQPPPQECQYDQTTPRVSADSAPRSSPDSWSDDSIYLEAERLHTSTSLAESPNARVRDWLSTTDEDGHISASNEMAENLSVHLHGPALRDRTAVKPNDVTSDEAEMSTNNFPAYLLHSRRQVSDTCKTFAFDQVPAKQAHKIGNSSTRYHSSTPTATYVHATPPQACASSRREDLELSPLSPNVCTERGPSRYHKFRTAEIEANPPSTSLRLPFGYQRRCFKENVALSNGTPTQGPPKDFTDRGTSAHHNS